MDDLFSVIVVGLFLGIGVYFGLKFAPFIGMIIILIGIGLLVWWIFSLPKQILEKKERKKREEQSVYYGKIKAAERKGDLKEAKFYEEIAKIVSRAKSLGFPHLFEDLFFNNISYYPVWIKKGELAPPNLKLAEKLEQKEAAKLYKELGGIEDKQLKIQYAIRFIINDKEYVFFYSKGGYTDYFDNSRDTTEENGALQLFSDGHQAIFFRVKEMRDNSDNPYGGFSYWEIGELLGFVEGDWINEFRNLSKYHAEKSAERMRSLTTKVESDEKDNLKKGFRLS